MLIFPSWALSVEATYTPPPIAPASLPEIVPPVKWKAPPVMYTPPPRPRLLPILEPSALLPVMLPPDMWKVPDCMYTPPPRPSVPKKPFLPARLPVMLPPCMLKVPPWICTPPPYWSGKPPVTAPRISGSLSVTVSVPLMIRTLPSQPGSVLFPYPLSTLWPFKSSVAVTPEGTSNGFAQYGLSGITSAVRTISPPAERAACSSSQVETSVGNATGTTVVG